MKRVPRFRVVLVLSFAIGTAFAYDVDDRTRSVARKLGDEGVKAYKKKDLPTAVDRLGRAYTLFKVPTLGLWLARALKGSGRLIEASERYLEVTRLPLPALKQPLHAKAQQDAQAERAALMPRIPQLTIIVEAGPVAGDVALLDGRAVPAALIGVSIPIDPGRHRIDYSRGSTRVTREIMVRQAEIERIDIALPRRLATASRWTRPPVMLATGASALGFGVAVYFGVQALQANDAVEQECQSGIGCSDKGMREQTKRDNYAYIADGAAALGVLALGFATYSWFKDDNSASPTGVVAHARPRRPDTVLHLTF